MKKVLLLTLLAAAIGGCSSSNPSNAGAPPCDIPYVAPEDCEAAHGMLLPAALPAARGNQYADSEDAATLGFQLFFSANLGSGVACATCHAPELTFTDRLSVAKGKAQGTRNSPTTFNAARLSVIFWDGRADSLWSQPLFAIENPVEMDSSRLELAHFVALDATLKPLYEKVFGALPDMTSWPPSGKPGDMAFDSLTAETQTEVNRLSANVGKALEAYLRKNFTGRAALDRFLEGDKTQLTKPAQRGLGAFLQYGCQGCHTGSLLTDEKFHDVGFPSLPGAAPDPGRAGGIPILAGNIFNLAGPFADPPSVVSSVSASVEPSDVGAFRTPSLRNVEQTYPYGHDGALSTLPDVLAMHAAQVPASDQQDILAFLDALDGDYPLPPWNNWPSPQ